MEEKSSGFTVSPQFPALLQSVQLQFLSGCFALGTQIIGSHSGANYEMQHYMVRLVIMLSCYLCRCLWSVKTERKNEWIFNLRQMERRETLNIVFIWYVSSALTCCFVNYSSIPLISIQSGTHSASIDTQRELQSAAHTFYQQVVRVLKQRVLLEREHPGLLIIVSHVFNNLGFLLNCLVGHFL